MRLVFAGLLSFVLCGVSFGYEAKTTTGVNLRAGPGTSYKVLRTLRADTLVEVQDCNESGSWCGVRSGNLSGFTSGRYLSAVDAPNVGWPRAYELGGEETLVLYEPQISEWENFSKLKAMVAAEYRTSKSSAPIFGVIELSADTARAAERDEVLLSDIKIDRLDFSALDRSALAKLQIETGKLLPTGNIAVKEERLAVSLANSESVADVEGLNAQAPVIFHTTKPSILVMSDGDATFAPIKGSPGVEFLINTNWDLFKVKQQYWLRVNKNWLAADSLEAEWKAVSNLPKELSKLPQDGNWDETIEALDASGFEDQPPHVFYSSTPSELIQFSGEIDLIAVPGTALLWASNTQSDLFKHSEENRWYYLTSGRWFRAPSLDGPWEFATPELPDGFLLIPEDQPYYSVLASVPGTSEANEARIRASIPETARVEIGAVKGSVSYSGEPKFVKIEGTNLFYATNTDAQVIRVGDMYYMVQDGIWFVSNSANGPWEMATEVPSEIYNIPPSSPVHNTTYVKIYRVEDNHVWCGYTAGYLHGFLAWGIIAYGSGWYYPPYWHYWDNWNGYPRYPIYYPRPITYGGGIYYNPALGSFGRYGYAYGPYRGIEAGARWNPSTGSYVRGAKVYGPRGTRGFVSAYNPRTGTRAVARGGEGIYGRWGSAKVTRGSEYLSVKAAQGNRGAKAVRWQSSRADGAVVSRRGNVYASRDGNVYRNTGNGWQKWDKDGGWSGVERPDTVASNKREQLTYRKSKTRAERDTGRQVKRDNPRTRAKAQPQKRKQAARPAPQKRTPVAKPAQRQRQVVPKARQKVPQRVGRSQQVRRVSNQRSNRNRQYKKPRASSSRSRGGTRKRRRR